MAIILNNITHTLDGGIYKENIYLLKNIIKYNLQAIIAKLIKFQIFIRKKKKKDFLKKLDLKLKN